MIKRLLKYFTFKIIESINNWENNYSDIILKQKCVAEKDTFFYNTAKIELLSFNRDKIKIKSNCHIRGELLIFKHGGKIEIGEDCYIGEGCRIWSGDSIKIGNNVLISHNVNIFDTNSHEIDHLERANGYINLIKNGHPKDKGLIITAPIVIEDYAWISFNSIILKGVTIGKGAIVAAGSVVTKNVEPFTMVAGNPAKFIKKINEKAD